jgi:hypothetical protein
MERNTCTWKVKISDGFCEYEYAIRGNNDICINDIAVEVEKFLAGKITDSRLVPRD